MNERSDFDAQAPSVQSHLSILQGIIQRMTDNSRSCKVWCVTLVSAILVFTARVEEPNYVLIALVPTVLFLILDTYYLALERAFRHSYNDFVRKLHESRLTATDLFAISPTGSVPRHFISCLLSFSILPFYPTLIIMTIIIWRLLV